MTFKTINNLMGWGMFALSLTVYALTLEPSVSLWDCGEFTAAAYKLQVVHAPGAPLFLMLGRLVSLFTTSPQQVAYAINMLSAVFSALTVLFTFWITTRMAIKIKLNNASEKIRQILIILAGIISAMALTFCDTFWFSAVEAEVYAMSSFITALTFWCALKWEDNSSPYANKWLLLIAYLIGLSIGTHLLSLLVIPAIAFIVYFKKFKVTRKGLLLCFVTGMAVLFFIQNGVIPGIPHLMAKADLMFVNTLGFGFGSGMLFVIILLLGSCAYGIYYFGKKKKHPVYQLTFIAMVYVLLGYSSYAMVLIRSNDHLPIDMGNPEEPFNLVSYINREQYVQRPLMKGPYYNAPAVDVVTGATMYRKDVSGYTPIGEKREYVFEADYNTFFPRMGDMQSDNSPAGYRYWGGMDEIEGRINYLENSIRQTADVAKKKNLNDELTAVKAEKPTMGNNLMFFFRYQLNHMYFRYFMWNFAGRQNDRQGFSFSEYTDGNWISGIPFLDNIRLGPQNDLPDAMAENKGRNKFYLIPFILGCMGFVVHWKKQRHQAFVMSVFFVFTGLLIIVFLNQPPFEPRERDYVHVGSFQVFCVWIGMGVLWLFEKLVRKIKPAAVLTIVAVAGLSAPVLMGSQGWDDHDRSKRYIGIDFAFNYLNSCPPNAILLCNGDNDTYPLWYAQNVEGIRKDVRIINQNLLPSDWYSRALLKKVYDSEPLPLTLTNEQLAAGENDYFQFEGNDVTNQPADLRQFINQLVTGRVPSYHTRKFIVPVDIEKTRQQLSKLGLDTAGIQQNMMLDFPARGISKGDLVVLDLIATNAARGWERPICFSATVGSDGLLSMEPYMERRGLVYQLTPVRYETHGGDVTKLSDNVLWDLLMHKYKFYGLKEKQNFFLDDKADLCASYLQEMFVALSAEYISRAEEIKFRDSALVQTENKEKYEMYRQRAVALLDKCNLEIPDNVLPVKGNMRLNMAMIYRQAGQNDKAAAHLKKMFESSRQEVYYFTKFNGRKQGTDYIKSLANDAMEYMRKAYDYAGQWGLESEGSKMAGIIRQMEPALNSFLNNN